ncbi:MAG: glycosyltransferase family 1 protein [Candidatus Latescibacterota bacterium]|nr:MAG: glycosyltransferase family 1 protein [Candidatus Latescibacterota bacterium]
MRPWDEGIPARIDPASERLRGETILCFGWSDWDSGTQTWNQILRRLAYRNLVVFVPPPLERTEVFGSRYAPNGKHAGISHVEDHLYVYRFPHFLPNFYKPGSLVRSIHALRRRGLRRALRRLGAGRPVLYLLHPKFRGYVGAFDEKLVLYHILDEYTGYIGANKERLRAEEATLLDRADLVVCVAPGLREAKSAPYRNVLYVPNGVDYDRFSPDALRDAPVPEDLASIRGPVAGYIGRICDKLDFRLLHDVAKLLPGVMFCFVGPALVVLRQNRDLFDKWIALPNVRLLGAKRNEEVPGYVGAFDVGLLPYLVNSETEDRYPLKLHEYLAAGKPIVSVPLSCFGEVADLVHTAAGDEKFAEGIRAALAGEPPEKTDRRLAVARAHDWDRIAFRIDDLLRERLRRTDLATWASVRR